MPLLATPKAPVRTVPGLNVPGAMPGFARRKNVTLLINTPAPVPVTPEVPEIPAAKNTHPAPVLPVLNGKTKLARNKF